MRSVLLASLALCALCFVASPLLSAEAALPAGFLYGTATAAYQIEGSPTADGKQRGEWDVFSHLPGKIAHNDTGDQADEGYVHSLDDVQLLRKMGVNAYRFSLSWSRIIDENGNVNPRGVAHYSALIDALLAANIEPVITVYHWDMPLQYGTMAGQGDERGWLNAEYIVPLFVRYADAVFAAFGDRVKRFIVFNEPHSFCVGGFATGSLAPGRCSDRTHCDKGDSSTEPYICAHNVLLAWSAAAKLWRSTYAPRFGQAQLGFSLDSGHAEPYTDSPADVAAAERAMLFNLGWWADVLFLEQHDYPPAMRKLVGDRLPTFTAEQKKDMQTPDFFGFNHYTTFYVFDQTNSTDPFSRDQQAGMTYVSAQGELIGAPAESTWLYVVPWGFPKALQWIAQRYPGVPILVTENGVDAPGESSIPLPKVLQDTFRVNYLRDYLSNMTEVAIGKMGLPVVGYFVWSLMDNFEWADGYTCRFGLHYVDYTQPSKPRYAKDSVAFYTNWIQEQKALTAKAQAQTEDEADHSSNKKHGHKQGRSHHKHGAKNRHSERMQEN